MFGKGCEYLSAVPVEDPEITHCKHKDNTNDHEGNCTPDLCPISYTENTYLTLYEVISMEAYSPKAYTVAAASIADIVNSGAIKNITSIQQLTREVLLL